MKDTITMTNPSKNFLVLGIETSCDETAAAVYAGGIKSNILFSQIELHKQYGGVVPELASRSHLEKINPIVQSALDKAGITLDDLDCIAVTHKPGLPGSLLVGLCFAKALAMAKNIPLIGVDHLEGHIFSAHIEHSIPFPHLCLTASGGHTAMYLVHGFGDYELLGETADDAAGEAFDKIAKLLKLPYPGGPVIEKLAAQTNFEDYFKYPRLRKENFDFSFSGLKTAVLYDMIKRGDYDMQTKTFIKSDLEQLQHQVASSLLVCIADIFSDKYALAFKKYPKIKAAAFVGGVACNKYIRNVLKAACDRRGINFYVPSPQYCTDNAAMIAFVGHYKAQQGKFSDLTLDILK